MKKLFTLFLLTLLPLMASADAVEIDGIYYNLVLKAKVAEVTSNPNGYSGEVIIPEKVTYEEIEYSVMAIGGSSFSNCRELTSIIIPNSVTIIGEYAFSGCGISSLTIPNSVTSISEGSFSDCKQLLSVSIGSSVKAIGSFAFAYCNFTKITLPSSIEEIGDQAFSRGFYSFHDETGSSDEGGWEALSRGDDNYIKNRIEEVHISDINSWLRIKFASPTANPLHHGGKMFVNGEELHTLVIPESVTKLDDSVFYGCSSLTSLSIPNSVTSIGDFAFNSCQNLTSLSIPSSVTYIGGWAFENCKNLLSVTIPNSVTSIGKIAFWNCEKLSSFVIPSSVSSIEYGTFSGCKGLNSVTIENGVKSIGANAFYGCSNLTSIIIPNSITAIEGSAFYECEKLESLSIGDNLTSIGEWAFYRCLELTSLTIPNSVTSIGEHAFQECYSLSFLSFGNNLTTIGEWAFNRCVSLTTVTLPNSLTSINNNVFNDCSGLNVIKISENVNSIDECAFSSCYELTDVFCYSKNVPQTNSKAFQKTNIESVTLHIPFGSVDDYKSASPWKNFKDFVVIDEDNNTEDNVAEDEIKITSVGQTTWCSAYDLDFTDVDGLKAYTAEGYDRETGTIWLMRVKKVPAGEGILLIGDEGEYHVPHKSITCYYGNFMVGTVTAKTIYETEGEYTNYYLSNGDYGVGFYKVNGSVDLKANRAYLPLLKNTVSSTRGFIGIDFDDDSEATTGISNNNSEPITNNIWYNLQGQRVDNPGKGIYIKNGKVVVIK